MHVPRFDIFAGVPSGVDRDAFWMESVDGLAAACERMKHYAASRPGSYFVFSMSRHQTMASINTSAGLFGPSPAKP
jgi:hypothetical protein